jgi:hypothetical protein
MMSIHRDQMPSLPKYVVAEPKKVASNVGKTALQIYKEQLLMN